MPVLEYVPQDPTDLVLQGEQMRMSVFDSEVNGFQSLVVDEDAYLPMNSFIDGTRLSVRRNKSGELQMRANAGIATPCGAWIWLDWSPLINRFVQGTSLWTVSGVTRDSAGAALGNCRVVALEVSRIQLNGAPVVAETISDGSGNYSVVVPMNVAYQIVAYKPGSPDVGGVSLNTVVPVQV